MEICCLFKIKPDSEENYNLDWELCIELQDNRFAPLMKESVTNDSFLLYDNSIVIQTKWFNI